MNQRYIDYAKYNIWANNRMIGLLSQQSDELLGQELVGSFPTIRVTVSHIWFAEVGWLSRLNGNGWEASIVTDFEGSNKELFKLWQTTSVDFGAFVENADLEAPVDFEHKGEHFSIPAREIAHTVFNHGTYHRGQLVIMMRQLGVSDIVQTDYIEWVRESHRRST